MTLPVFYLDPVTFGDCRAGAESIETVRNDARLALGLSWLSGLTCSQGRSGLVGSLRQAEVEGKNIGDWTIDVSIEGIARTGDPAHRKRLRLDGEEILDVLSKVDPGFGQDVAERLWRVGASLIVQAQLDAPTDTWIFPTPLGRMITIEAKKTNLH